MMTVPSNANAGQFRDLLPALVAAAVFALHWPALMTLATDWADNQYSHGLLLVPIAGWMMGRRGLVAERQPDLVLGTVLVTIAVVFRVVASLLGDLFVMRLGLLVAVGGLLVLFFGKAQIQRWALPLLLLTLSVPLPDYIIDPIIMPLQLTAAHLGGWMLENRHVPNLVTDIVIWIPNHQLLIAESCSGLRSMTAVVALGVLVGGTQLHQLGSRVLLVASCVLAVILLNGVRVFWAGFAIHFIDPRLGRGLPHQLSGWAVWGAAFVVLMTLTWALRLYEQRQSATLPG